MATPAPELPATAARSSDERRECLIPVPDGDAPSVAGEMRQRERWLVAASRGDAGAFAELYDDVAPQLHGLVLRILRDVHEAESLTQRIFLEIWRSAARFDTVRGGALSWMITVAHRMCVEHVRTTPDRDGRVRSAPGRHAIAEGGTDLVPPVREPQPDPVPQATVLSGAFADLEPTQRHALKLAYYNAHSHGEVGQLLRIPSAAAKATLTRGLQGLGRGMSVATS